MDDYLNGVADYQDCQLSDNGKYVVCIDEDNIVSINLSTGATTTSTESNYRINVS
ncbi:MAG: hypothetical protein LBG52_05030 [Candidatus Peribacteria bacterium]|nr:hypothetical protein [Candidatus Peribacteria bacterium]